MGGFLQSNTIWDYLSASNPAVDTNPDFLFVHWLNTDSQEWFVCIDNTVGANIWKGNQGTTIS